MLALLMIGCAAVPWSMLGEWSAVDGYEVEGCVGECAPLMRFADHGDAGRMVQAWAVDQAVQHHAERVADDWSLTLDEGRDGYGQVDGCEVELHRGQAWIEVVGEGCGVDWLLTVGE